MDFLHREKRRKLENLGELRGAGISKQDII